MRMKLLLAAAAAALAAVAAASAGAAGGGIAYSFIGKLSTAPSGGHISIAVDSANRPALRALLGSSVAQTFTYGDKTEFLRWTNGVPKVVQAGDLQAGDYVRVNVRAPRGSSLATIESTAAGLIGDHGTQLTARPAGLPVPWNRSCGRLVHGLGPRTRRQPARAAAPARQLAHPDVRRRRLDHYLLWQGKVPTVIDRSDLKVGDKVAIHVRAKAGSTLGQVTGTPAAKVAEHEPAAQA